MTSFSCRCHLSAARCWPAWTGWPGLSAEAWGQGPGASAAGPAAAFLDAVEWFEGWLAPVVRRPLKAGTYWCRQWQEHAEAVERVRALWEAWEAARAEGGNAMSYWWTVHFDAHWAALADSAGGPFSACARRGQHSTDLRALPSDFDGAEE